MPSAVPKPSDAGSPVVALANTKSTWANVRNGPGTGYSDIGDVFNNSIVEYYPNSRTSDNWYWVEHNGLAGWIYGGVVQFEEKDEDTRPGYHGPTPYDGKVAIWHWKGRAIRENTIAELVANIKSQTPNVNALFVKTQDSTHWQGEFDDGDMAVTGPAAIDRWVSVLQQNGLEFHAWCVLHGLDIDTEADIIIQTCQRSGVKTMILDIEPYAGYWQGGSEAIRPLMTKVRNALGSDYHIGLSVDPRSHHYNTIYPDQWFPFVDSVHPQTYWNTFRQTPETAIGNMYSVWGGYGRTVIPILQGDAPQSEQETGHALATQRYGAPGLSWWRYGVISQWGAVDLPVEIKDPGQNGDDEEQKFADEVLLLPESSGFRRGTYTGQEEFTKFSGIMGWDVLYKSTEDRRSKVWAEWRTQLPESGYYEIATFVPGRHATTKRARFKVHAVRGTDTEVVVDIDQSRYRNVWVPLGIFDLDKNKPNAGKVFLNDVTGETDKEIAFDAIRWRRIVTTTPDKPTPPTDDDQVPPQIDGIWIADGYDSPVGTAEERAATKLWPSGWRDATGFGSNTVAVYISSQNSYHTGVDLNWGRGPYDDRGVAVYSPASGVVIYQADLRPWGNVTIIRHDPLKATTGKVMYSRYGHMQNVIVRVGQRVTRGQKVGEIGDGNGRFIPHLHYDLCATTVLETKPGDWPGMDLARLLKHYVDPLAFIAANRP